MKVTVMNKTMTLKETGTAYALTLDEARLRQAPFAIERDGEPVAAVVPIDEYQEFIAWRERVRPSSPTHAEDVTLRDQALSALDKERAAFLDLKDELLRTHRGAFVAVLDGQVIDVDKDDRALIRRVYAEHGYVPIYVDRVAEKSPVRRILSPKKVVS